MELDDDSSVEKEASLPRLKWTTDQKNVFVTLVERHNAFKATSVTFPIKYDTVRNCLLKDRLFNKFQIPKDAQLKKLFQTWTKEITTKYGVYKEGFNISALPETIPSWEKQVLDMEFIREAEEDGKTKENDAKVAKRARLDTIADELTGRSSSVHVSALTSTSPALSSIASSLSSSSSSSSSTPSSAESPSHTFRRRRHPFEAHRMAYTLDSVCHL